MIDTHAHYGDSRFEPELDELLEKCHRAGVEKIINSLFIGNTKKIENPLLQTEKDSAMWKANEKMREKLLPYEWIYFTVGIHPNSVSENHPNWVEELQKMAAEERVIAIGETGLDYHYNDSEDTKMLQNLWFRKHVELAEETSLPLVLHMRDVGYDGVQILRDYTLSDSGDVHCFTGDWDLAKAYLDMGLYLGLGGKITRPENEELRDVVKRMPADRMLLETDAPFVRPAGCTAKYNTSLELPKVIQAIAEVRNMSFEDVIRVTTENAKRLFRL